ncbi:MAG TPA: PIN domain-containing protein [Iamia sp.]|nr:PIN domain-containing protein [Iamia sp.]
MTLLDAYGLVAYLAYEPCADEVEDLLRDGAHIASVNLAEVVDRMARLYEADIEDEISAMEAGGLDVVPVDSGLAVRAGDLRGRRYDKRTADVSMADCIAAVTALHLGIPLATSDPALAAMVVAEGGAIVALPDSRGVRPE